MKTISHLYYISKGLNLLLVHVIDIKSAVYWVARGVIWYVFALLSEEYITSVSNLTTKIAGFLKTL